MTLSTNSTRRRYVIILAKASTLLETQADLFQADDELEEPYLAGFEWDKEESWTRFKVHCKKTGDAPSGGKKKKAKGGDE